MDNALEQANFGIGLTWKWSLCFIVCLALSGTAQGKDIDAEFDGFELSYDLHARGMVIGHTTMKLSVIGPAHFVYESQSAAVGLAALIRNDSITERSEFALHEGMMRSLRYRYERVRNKKPRTVVVEFDWQAYEAINTARGNTWRMPIPIGALDKLNYLLAVMADLAAGRRDFSYAVADGGKLKTFALEHLREEQIDTALGQFQTVVLRRSRKQGRRVTTLWCAVNLGFAPVQVEHRETDGNVVTLQLTKVAGQVRPLPLQ